MQNDQLASTSPADRFASETKHRKFTKMANLLPFVSHKTAVGQLKGYVQ
jgi:hypothetical protein